MMTVNIVIFIACMFGLSSGLFFGHHHSAAPHTRIHVCLTPPKTMAKVQKHIDECQQEVKTSIFTEAFSLIKEHAFKHPDDDQHHLDDRLHDIHDLHGIVHDDDTLTPRNFTLTDHKILQFFDENVHLTSDHLAVDDHTNAAVDYVNDDEQIVSTPKFNYLEPTLQAPLRGGFNEANWNNYANDHSYKKTDSIVPLNGKNSNQQQQQHQHKILVARAAAAATTAKNHNPYTYFNINVDASKRVDRLRRDAPSTPEYLHSTAATFKDKRIAGCLMHCLYMKDNAIDKTGYPTLDGLVNFYSDGVHEHAFFMTTLRAVDYCLKGASHKYHINRHTKPDKKVSCDLAFDIFDCVSDKITEYCSQHHYHNAHVDSHQHGHEEYHHDEPEYHDYHDFYESYGHH